MARVSHGVWTVTLVVATIAACGARTGLTVPGVDAGSADAPPGSDAPSCTGTEIPLDVNAPNLYFVLDASGSMNEQSKWTNVQAVVAQLITQLGPRARFGAAVFPAPLADECATGVEVMPMRLGDSQGATASAFMAATSLKPIGGTPTAATLEALLPELSAFPQATFAILATDGGPNCDAALACGADQCTSNMDGQQGCPVGGPPNCCDPTTGIGGLGCLDGPRAAQAVADLRSAGIETFVLGIPGSAPYAAVLDQLATAGGTARPSEPLYYRVDSADTSALGAAFAEIGAQITASCTFILQQAAQKADDVNVYVGGAIVPRDGPDGWTLDGKKLTLEGATCASLQNGSVLSVRVVEGCPTVTR
jgi:hypothetical protein